MDRNVADLIDGYLSGTLCESEINDLTAAVQSSPITREKFQEEMRLHVLLREAMAEQVEINFLQQTNPRPETASRRWIAWIALANAAVLLITYGIFFGPLSDSNAGGSFGVCLNVSGSTEVRVQREGKFLALTPGVRIRVGDQIMCGDQSHATLQLTGGSILSLNDASQLTIVSERPEINLERGEVHFEVVKRNSDAAPFRVNTNESTVDVMGTVFGLTENGQTKLEVYEGRVSMLRHRDSKRIEVGSQQSASTEGELFSARRISRRSGKTIEVLPTDDMTLTHGKRATYGDQLKVEGDKRVVYLRFGIPQLPEIQAAKLLLTQAIDTGSGRLQIHLGEHSNWKESNLSKESAPQPLSLVDEHLGVVSRGQVIELDVSEVVAHPGPVSFILTLDKSEENDIWFSSREGGHPPRLILSVSEK